MYSNKGPRELTRGFQHLLQEWLFAQEWEVSISSPMQNEKGFFKNKIKTIIHMIRIFKSTNMAGAE